MKDSAGGVISIHNVMEVAMLKNDSSDVGFGDCEYIRTLCQQSFSGPLVSGNVGSKELNKWIDDSIANCDSQDADYREGEALKMLLSLLKIACQYYGKLRSAFGADPGAKVYFFFLKSYFHFFPTYIKLHGFDLLLLENGECVMKVLLPYLVE